MDRETLRGVGGDDAEGGPAGGSSEPKHTFDVVSSDISWRAQVDSYTEGLCREDLEPVARSVGRLCKYYLVDQIILIVGWSGKGTCSDGLNTSYAHVMYESSLDHMW